MTAMSCRRFASSLHDLQHLADHLRVERARQPSKEHDTRAALPRSADDNDTLFLPAGRHWLGVIRAVGKPDTGQKLQRPSFRFTLSLSTQHRRNRHV